MRSKATLFLLAAGLALGQEAALDPHSSIQIQLAPDSPLALVSGDFGQSRITARGGAAVLDLHMGISLKNQSARRVRGVTLLVLAQEVTPGGKASVSVPSLDIAPGASFPVRVDLRLMRPLHAGPAPVRVSLDGVLFEDLTFYGPDRLDSRRAMTAWEMEAQRDRQHFKSILAARGREGLRRAMLDSLARQTSRPRLDVRLARGRSISAAAEAPEREARFAFLKFPDSPVEPIEGVARVTGNEAQSPRIQVANRSGRSIQYLEIGWIVRDNAGEQFWAASVPAARGSVLAPGAIGQVTQDTSLRFSRPGGEPLAVSGMTGYVSQVQFTDGKVWIPQRASLEAAHLLPLVAPSPEEQRLTDLYRTKSIDALIEELRKF
jgi:hypothetical protein